MKINPNNKRNIQILSIVIACFTWIFVMFEVDPVVTRRYGNVPIQTEALQQQLLSEDLIMNTQEKYTTNVVLKAKRSILADLTREKINLIATIENSHIGDNIANLTFNNSIGMQVSLRPDHVVIPVQSLESKNIAVTYQLSPEDAQKYELNYVSIDPSILELKGSQEQLSKVKQLVVEIPISETQSNSTLDLVVVPVDENKKVVDQVFLTGDMVKVNFSYVIKKSIPVELNWMDGEENPIRLSAYKADPEKVDVEYTVNTTFDQSSLKTVPISFANRTSLSGIKSISLALPEGVKSSASKVDVQLVESNLIEKSITYNRSMIKQIGMGGETFAQLLDQLPEQIVATFQVSKELVDFINDENTVLTIQNDPAEGAAAYRLVIESDYPLENVALSTSQVIRIP